MGRDTEDHHPAWREQLANFAQRSGVVLDVFQHIEQLPDDIG